MYALLQYRMQATTNWLPYSHRSVPQNPLDSGMRAWLHDGMIYLLLLWVRWFIQSFIYSSIRPCIRSFIHPFMSCFHASICSAIHLSSRQIHTRCQVFMDHSSCLYVLLLSSEIVAYPWPWPWPWPWPLLASAVRYDGTDSSPALPSQHMKCQSITLTNYFVITSP